MKNVIILGASGNIAKHVINMLVKKDDINLTLFLRNKNRLRNKDTSRCRIVESDVLDYDQLREAMTGQDVVYANLSGDLEAMAKTIVRAMDEMGVKKTDLHQLHRHLRRSSQARLKAVPKSCGRDRSIEPRIHHFEADLVHQSGGGGL